MEKKSSYLNYTYVFIAFLCSFLFWLNLYHTSQQGIWAKRYVELAGQILKEFRYAYPSGDIATYPMWGYPILTSFFGLLGQYENILYFHFFLLLLTFYLILKNFEIPTHSQRLSFIAFYGALIFYSMLLSVKWPDAILAFLLFMFCLCHYKEKNLVALCSLGLAFNFRSEALIFFLIYAIYIVFTQKKIVTVILAFIFILPWPAYQYINHKTLVLTSTNSGGSIWEGLGELPDNKWRRVKKDEYVEKFAQQRGIDDPWGIEGKKLFMTEYINDVKQYPLEFGRKVLHSTLSMFTGGFYVTEFRTLVTKGNEEEEERLTDLASFYKKNKKIFFKALMNFKPEAVCLFLLAVIQRVSIILFPMIFLLAVFRLIKGKDIFLAIPIFLIILAQMAICSIIQYSPRHISHILPLFLFASCYQAFEKPPLETMKDG